MARHLPMITKGVNILPADSSDERLPRETGGLDIVRRFVMRFEAFVPRSESRVIFAIAMGGYAWLLTNIVHATIRTVHRPFPQVSLLPDWLYWSTMVIDTLLITAIFEVLRWLRVSVILQVVLVSVLLSATRAFSNPLWTLTVAPIYILCALSYVFWRSRSWWAAVSVVFLTQVVYDIVPAIRNLFGAVPSA